MLRWTQLTGGRDRRYTGGIAKWPVDTRDAVTPLRHLPLWGLLVPSDPLLHVAVAKSGVRRCCPEPIAPPPHPPSAANPDWEHRSAIPSPGRLHSERGFHPTAP